MNLLCNLMVSREKKGRARMKRRKVMKAIAAAGIAIGGAGAFQNGNMVYAAELDQEESDELILPAEEEETLNSETPEAEVEEEAADSEASEAEEPAAPES